MVNKIISRRGTRNRYSKRKRYSKYRKYHTRKNRKHIQKQKRMRRQTRRKFGGKPQIIIPTEKEYEYASAIYTGFALVTKLGLFGTGVFSKKDRPEEIIIFKVFHDYYIARCANDNYDSSKCSNKENIRVMKVKENTLKRDENEQSTYFFTSEDNDKYRLKILGRNGSGILDENDTQFLEFFTRQEQQQVV